MIRAPRVWISRPCVANEPLAEETSRPRTSAATVAVTPLASLTTSLLSAFRWWVLGQDRPERQPEQRASRQAGRHEQRHRRGAHGLPPVPLVAVRRSGRP